jgi:hypothetical protein
VGDRASGYGRLAKLPAGHTNPHNDRLFERLVFSSFLSSFYVLCNLMVGHRLFECPAEAAFATCGPFSCRSESTALRSRAFRRMESAQPLLGKRCHSLCSQFRFGPVHRSSDNGTRASEHLQHLRRGWLDFLHLIATSASATIFASVASWIPGIMEIRCIV